VNAIEFGWTLWFVVGGAVVVVAASLLVAILLVARGIERDAGRALAAAVDVRARTQPIWLLGTALDLSREVRNRVEAIEEKAGALAGTVHGADGGARKEER
jgi:hypothetical protein